MSSVTENETAIQKLSVAEQRIIALHLGTRLVDEGTPAASAVADEGIRFLPQSDANPGTPRVPKRKRKLRQQVKTTR
jgi:alpha-D-ribose 1-methylphosphonate 5-triphosphate synthase subunit PhnH